MPKSATKPKSRQQTQVEHSEAPPAAEQRRLSFGLGSAREEKGSVDSPVSSLTAFASAPQGILLREGKACAKLVKARLDITAAASSAGTVAPGVQVVTLTYDYWQPVCSKSRKPGQARFICIPVNELKLADYRVQVIGGESGKAFAIPVDFCFSGSTAAAALETHLQRLQYIRAQSQRFRDTRASEASSNSAHPCVWSQGEYTVTLGPEWSSCALTFNIREAIPTLQRIELTLAVLDDSQSLAQDIRSLTQQPMASATSPAPSGEDASQPGPAAGTSQSSAKSKGQTPTEAQLVGGPGHTSAQDDGAAVHDGASTGPNGVSPVSADAPKSSDGVMSDMSGEGDKSMDGSSGEPKKQRSKQGQELGDTSLQEGGSSMGSMELQGGSHDASKACSAASQASQPQQGLVNGVHSGSDIVSASDQHSQGEAHAQAAPTASSSTPSGSTASIATPFSSCNTSSSCSPASMEAFSGSMPVEAASGPELFASAFHAPISSRADGQTFSSSSCTSEATCLSEQQPLQLHQNGKRQAQMATYNNGKPRNGDIVMQTAMQALAQQGLVGAAAQAFQQHMDSTLIGSTPVPAPAATSGLSRAYSAPLGDEASQGDRAREGSGMNAELAGALQAASASTEGVPSGQQQQQLVEAALAAQLSEAAALAAGGVDSAGLLAAGRQQQGGQTRQGQPSSSGAGLNGQTGPAAQTGNGYPGAGGAQGMRRNRNSFNGTLPVSHSGNNNQKGYAQDQYYQAGRQQYAAGQGRHAQNNRGQHRYDDGSGAYNASGSRPSSRPPSRGAVGHGRHSVDLQAEVLMQQAAEAYGSTDIERFLIQVTPMLPANKGNANGSRQLNDLGLPDFTLGDIWDFYREPSLYGREVYTLGGVRGPSMCYFVPYLSAIQLFRPAPPPGAQPPPSAPAASASSSASAAGSEPASGEKPEAGAQQTGASAPAPAPPPRGAPVLAASWLGEDARHYMVEYDGVPRHMCEQFEYVEQELPFNRMPMYDQIRALSGALERRAVEQAAAVALAAAPPAAAAASSPASADGKASSSSAGGDGDDAVEAEDSEDFADAQEEDQQHEEAAEEAGGSETVGAAPAATAASAGDAPAAAAAAAPAQPKQAATSAPAPVPVPLPIGPSPEQARRVLYDTKIRELHPCSWYAVAWYPVYRVPDAPLYARFLTFHSFAPLLHSLYNMQENKRRGIVLPITEYPMPVVGLKWYNMQGERWLENLTEHPARSDRPDDTGGRSRSQVTATGRGLDHRWQAHLNSLQDMAERLARGLDLKLVGPKGPEEVRLRVPDFEFFRGRG